MRVAAAVLWLLLSGAAPGPQREGKITAIELRLFDPDKAEFSGNVLENGFYAGWNTFMMEGNAGEGRGDALVVVKVVSTDASGGYGIIHSPLTIIALRKGKLIASRRFSDIQTNSREVARTLYLPNVGCAGDIIVKAKLGDQAKAVRLAMGCGE